MVTVRTYWSLAEAALAKTVLDNYEIPCALLDENASLYITGQQVAVPVRLTVDEDQAISAIHILDADFEHLENLEEPDELRSVPTHEVSNDAAANRNPWELLLVAFYLLAPATALLVTKFPTDVGGRWARYMVARAAITKFLSWLAVIFAGVLIAFYFRVRRSSRSLTK